MTRSEEQGARIERPGGWSGVLHVATETGWRGGESQAHLLIRGLSERRLPQMLLTPRDSELIRRCRDIPLLESAILPGRGRYQPANYLELRRAVKRFRPALIHAHTAHAHALAWFAAPRDLPIIATRRVDFPPKLGLSLGRRYRSPRVFSIAISRAIERLLLDFGIPRQRVFLVPSGIDPARFSGVQEPDQRALARTRIRRELGVDDETFLIGNTAALTDHKGQTFLLRALAQLKHSLPAKTLCVIAGRGELEEQLESEIEELGLTGGAEGGIEARLLGFRQDIPEILAALDLFVLPSHLEGLGTAVIDATCMGLPIVATTAGGVPDILENETNALLVPPRDPSALASAIERMVREPELRQRLGSAAREAFEDGPFNAEAMVRGNLEVYRRVLHLWQDR